MSTDLDRQAEGTMRHKTAAFSLRLSNILPVGQYVFGVEQHSAHRCGNDCTDQRFNALDESAE
ncbi:hypothetical protein [Oryzifoliimicrobium ureilyticus]|uniref:hypothetical protein n=1 Tax=Oryzifoliimicrobium ureilyticus TaxID=3113724 RepID=UPI00307681E0